MATHMFHGASPRIFKNAKELRLNTTKHENILWECLRANRLEGVRFKRQHPISSFIADFYCHKAKLVIEVDGKYHESRADYDANRTSIIEEFGIRVIRFTNEDIELRLDAVIDEIRLAIQGGARRPL